MQPSNHCNHSSVIPLWNFSFFWLRLPLFPKKFSASTLAPQFSGKMHLVIKLLTSIKELTDDKVVIVSNYTQTIDMISRTLTKFKFSNFKLDGRIPTSKRQKMVDTFNDTYPFTLQYSPFFSINVLITPRIWLWTVWFWEITFDLGVLKILTTRHLKAKIPYFPS